MCITESLCRDIVNQLYFSFKKKSVAHVVEVVLGGRSSQAEWDAAVWKLALFRKRASPFPTPQNLAFPCILSLFLLGETGVSRCAHF